MKLLVRIKIPPSAHVVRLGVELPDNHLDSVRDLIKRDRISEDEAWERAAFDSVRMSLEREGVDANKITYLSVHKL